MLDVHVLTRPGLPEAWVTQRRDSIAAAVAQAGFPVFVRELEGEDGHIGRGRRRGYALGTQDYVTYVDHDDYLLPEAFAALHQALLTRPAAVCPGETHAQGGYLFQNYGLRHHLIAYRRDIATSFDHEAWAVCGDLALKCTLPSHDPVIDVADCSYVHRVYESGGRVLRRKYQDELKKTWAYG